MASHTLFGGFLEFSGVVVGQTNPFSNLLNQMFLMAQEHDSYLTLNKSPNDILVKNIFLNGGLFQVVLVLVFMVPC